MRFLLLLLLLCPLSIAPGARFERILFVGNSITYDPPAPGEPYFWNGHWGMNASAAHLDYVHLTWAGIAASQGYVPDMRIISAIYPADMFVVGDEIAKYDPDLIIVQWGEAAPLDMPQEDWDTIYRKIAEAANGARVLAVGMFGTHPIGERDERLQAAALGAGMIYVPFADLHAPRTAEMCAGLHPGVCNHPSDYEMAMLAGRILAAIQPQTYLPIMFGGGEIGTIPPGDVLGVK